MAWILRLVPRSSQGRSGGRSLYVRKCASCHRDDLHGTPPDFPSLVRIGDRYKRPALVALIRAGSGRMPGFHDLPEQAVQAIARYVISGEDKDESAAAAARSPFEQKNSLDACTKLSHPDGDPAVD